MYILVYCCFIFFFFFFFVSHVGGGFGNVIAAPSRRQLGPGVSPVLSNLPTGIHGTKLGAGSMAPPPPPYPQDVPSQDPQWQQHQPQPHPNQESGMFYSLTWRIWWSLRFETPQFKNFLHSNAGHWRHHSYSFSINIIPF